MRSSWLWLTPATTAASRPCTPTPVAVVPARLEALGVTAGLSRDAVHAQIAAALHVVVHLVRDDERRRVSEIGLLSPGA